MTNEKTGRLRRRQGETAAPGHSAFCHLSSSRVAARSFVIEAAPAAKSRAAPAARHQAFLAAERLMACLLALSSVVVWIALETTASDLLAAVPLLWALAVASHPRRSDARAFWSAALFGLSVAAKLSNGLFLPLLVSWWWQPAGTGRSRLPLARGLALAAGAAGAFLLAYAPWGWQVWQVTGNPLHPFAGWLFGR